MRVRISLIAVMAAGILAACGGGDNDTSTADGSRPAVSGQASAGSGAPSAAVNTNLPAPKALTGWQPGRLCIIVTSQVAADILGKPVVASLGAGYKDPDQIDECSYSVIAPNDEGIEKVFAAHVVVKKPASVSGYVQATRAELARGNELNKDGFPVTEFTVAGMDEAFYAHYQAFVTKGGVVVSVNNGGTGRFAPDDLVAFAAQVVAAVTVS